MKPTSLKIQDVVYETSDAVSIFLKQPTFKKIKYKPGQYLTLCVNISGKEYRRAYSLNSTMNIDDALCVTVKKVEGGTVSNYLFDNIKVGEKMKVIKPMGSFTIDPFKEYKRHFVMFCGGSGITPVMSITKSILHFEPRSTVSIVYCNRNEGSIIFNQKLNDLQAEFIGRLTIRHILSNPTDHWQGMVGRIDKNKIGPLLDILPQVLPNDTEFFICGPEGMMNEVKEGLDMLKVPQEKIHMESFASSAALAQNSEKTFETKDINLIYRKKQYTLTVTPDKSILDAALDEGIKIPYSCSSGSCATCMGVCTSGKVEMTGGNILSDNEKQEGYILTCVGHPVSDDVTIDIDKA